MRKINLIVVHCSATREGKDYTVNDIDKWHRQRGFSKIGYQFVIYRDGSIHTGRSIEEIGAHVKGYNSNSIGICYIGGLTADGKSAKDTRTPQQKKALRELISKLKKQFPNAKVCGHRDLSPDLNHDGRIEPSEWVKACPCFNAEEEYEKL